MADYPDNPPGLGTVRRWAATHGCVVRYVTARQRDWIDLLAELGSEATAADIRRHEGSSTVQHVHTRMHKLMHVGAVERVGEGKPGRPYRYRITPVGELLRHA